MNKPDCYQCKYRRELPGDAHSACRYPGNQTDLFALFATANLANAAKLKISAAFYGVKMGWFLWPVNFDPVWLEHCDGFSPQHPAHEQA